MQKIAAIGPKSLILGLKAFGIDVFFSTSSSQALESLKELKALGKHSVILIINDLLQGIPREEYKKLHAEHLPVILAIPGLKADDEDYILKLKKLAEKAVGSDILK